MYNSCNCTSTLLISNIYFSNEKKEISKSNLCQCFFLYGNLNQVSYDKHYDHAVQDSAVFIKFCGNISQANIQNLHKF